MISSPYRICILSFSPVYRDARVLRQIKYLSKRFHITTIGYGELGVYPAIKMHSIRDTSEQLPGNATIWQKIAWRYKTGQIFLPPTRLMNILYTALGKTSPHRAYEWYYWRTGAHHYALAKLVETRADIIHANDWNALPVAVRASEKTGARIVLDLHEYAPLELENNARWRKEQKPVIEYFLKKYISKATATVTVNQTIAEKYTSEYGVSPLVVMNAPDFNPAVIFKKTEPERIRLIHHGGALSNRKLELMIDTLALANTRYTLHFMLVGDEGYMSALKTRALQRAPGRIFFDAPAPPDQVVSTIARFDMGFYLLPPENFNDAAATPNKFFDFLNAGLAVSIGPSPEMARLIRQYDCGIVAPSYNPVEVANILNQLSSTDIDRMKMKALNARKVLNADVEMGKLIALYERLFTGAL